MLYAFIGSIGCVSCADGCIAGRCGAKKEVVLARRHCDKLLHVVALYRTMTTSPLTPKMLDIYSL